MSQQAKSMLNVNLSGRKPILLVCTSHDALPDGTPTGAWISEVAIPYVIFKSNGFDSHICSPKGGPVPIDPKSLKMAEDAGEPETTQFLTNDAAMQLLKSSIPLRRVEKVNGTYSAVFIAGGHGAAFDLVEDKKLILLLSEAHAAHIPIAAICHGPAALVGVTAMPDGTGGPLVKGHTVTSFSNEEERASGKDKLVPFLLESRMREQGAEVICRPPGTENAIASRLLLTGQNPASAFRLASLVVETLTATYPEGSAANAPVALASGIAPPLHTGGQGAHSHIEVPNASEQRSDEEEKKENVTNPSYDDNVDFGLPDPSTDRNNEAKG